MAEAEFQIKENISPRVLIKGGGDLASGVAYRLHRTGWQILILEKDQPLAVRRTVSYASAIYQNAIEIEGLTARRVENIKDCLKAQDQDEIAVVPLSQSAEVISSYPHQILVDGRMLKDSKGTDRGDAGLVIGLGPGFTAGENCDAAVETCRGHFLGRALYRGSPAPDTGEPGEVMGYSQERVYHAAWSGVFHTERQIGERVQPGDIIGYLDEQPVKARIAGIIRGLLPGNLKVKQGTKLGDIDPRNNPEHCRHISDKSLAVGGGVLEAVFNWLSKI